MSAPHIPLTAGGHDATYVITCYFRYHKANYRDPNWDKLLYREKYDVLTGTITTNQHPKLYGRHPRCRKISGGPVMGYRIQPDCTFYNKSVAELRLQQHHDLIKFVDISGLKPAMANWDRCNDIAWDHSSTWRDNDKNLVRLCEPYVTDEFEAWCDANGWRYVLLPRHIGTYLAGTTFCLLAAPPKSRADLEAIAQRLILGWPA